MAIPLHSTHPQRNSVRLVLVYKNFAANRGVSHIGLGVSAMNTQRTLRRAGYWVEIWPANKPEDISTRLEREQAIAYQTRQIPVSHVVISAPWVPTAFLQGLLTQHHDVHFGVVSHSNIGFLMADPSGVRLLREAADLQISHPNFSVCGNSRRFCDAWSAMYGVPTTFLPNLYDVATIRGIGQRTPWHGGRLRIGIFGATRPLKNMVTASAACVELASRLRADVEINFSSGRTEGGGSVAEAIQQITMGLPHVKTQRLGWQSWPEFRRYVSQMHLLMQPSYTESFNMVTADGIAEGVASVVSDAIDWAPHRWDAHADDTGDVVRVATQLLHDACAVDSGQRALRDYVNTGVLEWQRFLLHHGG